MRDLTLTKPISVETGTLTRLYSQQSHEIMYVETLNNEHLLSYYYFVYITKGMGELCCGPWVARDILTINKIRINNNNKQVIYSST